MKRDPELTPTPTLNDDERAIVALVGEPGLQVILRFNRDEVLSAEQKLLEDNSLDLESVRYYQGYRHAAVALRQYIEAALEKAGGEY